MSSDHRPTVEAEVLVVGAGPAGLAAAEAAAAAGRRVMLVDAFARAGGQVWRARQGRHHPQVQRCLDRLALLGATLHLETRVVMPAADDALLIEGPDGARVVRWGALVLACGARERVLPFPGWTLPGVLAAGGAQALAKSGWPVRGKRVVVAGSGPLLLAVAASLRGLGARVVCLAEETRLAPLLSFAAGLSRLPQKLLQAALLAAPLVLQRRYLTGTRVLRADGGNKLESVVLTNGTRRWTVPCDMLAVGWGLTPNVELPQTLGCELSDVDGVRTVRVDDQGLTSRARIYAAGELTGIAGAQSAQLTGRIAGLAAAAAVGAQSTPPALRRQREFARNLAHTFAMPREARSRVDPGTMICRCEDVPWADLCNAADLRAAKLETRCGMGYCQGRQCFDILHTLRGWDALPAHLPPTAPVRLQSLWALSPESQDKEET